MKKVSFKKISIVNFLSIGEDPVTIEFKKGLHVITGNNKDKPDRRNAIGKSTIADALYFSIFGETLRELKKDLIPNNLTNGKTHVELDFELDSPKGKDEYKIIRTLSPSKVLIFKNGVDRTRDSIKNTTKYITEVLSASPAIFQNCVIMTVNNATPFMAKNKIEKRKFIEDIFGMEVFSTMLYALRNEYNELTREHDTEATKLEEVEKSYNSYFEQKDKTLQRRRDKKDIYLSRQKNNTKEKNELSKKLKQMKAADVTAIEDKVTRFQGKLTSCDDKINEYVSSISTSKAEVTHTKEAYKKIGIENDNCPVCLRGIEQHDTDHIEKEKAILKSKIEDMVSAIKDAQQSLEKAKEVKEQIQASICNNTKKISDAKLQLQDKQNILGRVEQINAWQKELKGDLEIIKSTETDFDSIIVETKKRLTILQRKIKKYRNHLAKLDIVKYVVSEEGVKSYIVNKLLELLNSKLIHYLKRLDSNSICIFNEYFEEEILNEKNKVCSYFNFSGAERKSIDLACLFTFSDIRRLQGGVQYNIAIYDELFDSSFDEKGIELITRILHDRVEELEECSIVISHRKESIKAVTGDVIFLEKENGITHRVDYKEI